ncbi:MAG: alpha/beta fold hydrolase [Clostridia bacterium]|nr:alpha/beta fold hydrolase [Clostridia bacterium]
MIFEKQVVNLYQGMMHTRCDDTETVFYFSADDFPGLKQESHPFQASAGHTLQGYVYRYEECIPNRLLVFDHGFGGGHRAYMKEIEMLCRHGYLVFAYDHTGCMESGGDSPNGLAQSLCDLNDCIAMLKSDERFASHDISVMGHSWGAFSTLNISALHPEISHIVAMSGFVSVEEMIHTFFDGWMKGYRKAILALEQQSNPKFVKFHAVQTLSHSATKALLIYSENDPMCRRRHYDILKAGLEERENVRFLFVSNKSHNPNYTEEAVRYLDEFGSARAKLARKKNVTAEEKAEFVASYDWQRMTEQDESFWQVIFEHLDH